MGRHFFSGMNDQARAGKNRLFDARVLLDASRYQGAMYLAGYAVECSLKAKLMRIFQCPNLLKLESKLGDRKGIVDGASVYTHQLEILLRFTQSKPRLRQNSEKWRDFLLVNQWIPAWRYSPDLGSHKEALSFLTAVESVLHGIDVNI